MKFKRFTKPQFLKGIGRPLLGKLFGKFASELAAKGVRMPPQKLGDDAYFKHLAGVAMSPVGLPDKMIEALFAIEEMANEEGQERLESAPELAQMGLKFEKNSSHGDGAVQVYLATPELLEQKHKELRLSRPASFEYYGCREPKDRFTISTRGQRRGWNSPASPRAREKLATLLPFRE